MIIIAKNEIEMKTLKIPYISELNSAEIEQSIKILEDLGKKESIEVVNWPDLYPYHPITFFNIGRSDKSIFIKFSVWGNMLRAVHSEDQKPVYEDSCVEFFCKIPENKYYANFEFNCIGTCSASQREGRDVNVTKFNRDEMLTIKRFPSIGRKAFNEMSGLFEWELTVEIPFELIGIDVDNLPQKLMANLYKCADATENPHYVSWNAVKTDKPDFHRPDFFGEMYF